jgi:glucose-6-phosphate isomerase/transaldolase/glucose-6-phosphate isomerase
MIAPAKMKSLCRPYWDEVVSREPVARLWRRDHTLWKPSPVEIANRLGWLDLPTSMRGAAAELKPFAAQALERGFRDVVLLGMGGSSLCAEVLRLAFPPREGFPKLHVLDSTVPAAIERVSRAADLAHTLFLVSSKSGGTTEVMSNYRYFRERVRELKGAEAGSQFVAITDDGTSLAKLAAAEGFWRTFVNPADLGGRYSVLSYFGLVAAALIGACAGSRRLSRRTRARGSVSWPAAWRAAAATSSRSSPRPRSADSGSGRSSSWPRAPARKGAASCPSRTNRSARPRRTAPTASSLTCA